jgi:S-adenosylmethionine:tRNA ribosyltransferase-isomerase
LRIEDFEYSLPPELIAQEPTQERAASRLFVLRRDGSESEHRTFRKLTQLVRPGDLLVANSSRVFPARLLGRRRGGGSAEVLLVSDEGGGEWRALLKPNRRLRLGDEVEIGPRLRVRVTSAFADAHGSRRVQLEADGEDAASALGCHGLVPLPPYIRRGPRPDDAERYQTVFARERGSVAAPTAGLHFTEELLAELAAHGVGWATIVLHVGPGTFAPVRVRDVAAHRLPPESYAVPAESAAAVRETRRRGGRVIAVGTTTARVLETVALDDGCIEPSRGQTALVIAPGFRFRVVDGLVTNFHLPRSSLLLLVAAFAGRERILDAYREAALRRYRFYSYGDAMLIL